MYKIYTSKATKRIKMNEMKITCKEEKEEYGWMDGCVSKWRYA